MCLCPAWQPLPTKLRAYLRFSIHSTCPTHSLDLITLVLSTNGHAPRGIFYQHSCHSLTHSLSAKKHAPQFSHNQILPPLSDTKLHAYQKQQKKLAFWVFTSELLASDRKTDESKPNCSKHHTDWKQHMDCKHHVDWKHHMDWKQHMDCKHHVDWKHHMDWKQHMDWKHHMDRTSAWFLPEC